jgi:hypothetical protein
MRVISSHFQIKICLLEENLITVSKMADVSFILCKKLNFHDSAPGLQQHDNKTENRTQMKLGIILLAA